MYCIENDIKLVMKGDSRTFWFVDLTSSYENLLEIGLKQIKQKLK